MTATSPVKINLISFKEWMTDTLSLTKIDTFKGQMALITVVKKYILPLKDRMSQTTLPKK